MNNTIKSALLYFSAALAGSLIYFVGSTIAHKNDELNRLVEATSPVVVDMRIVEGYKSNGMLRIRVVGKKVRDCGPPLSMIVRYGKYEEFKASVTFLDDVIDEKELSPKYKGIGDWDFGWWLVHPYPDNMKLSVYSVHDCDGVLVKTINGVWTKDQYLKRKDE